MMIYSRIDVINCTYMKFVRSHMRQSSCHPIEKVQCEWVSTRDGVHQNTYPFVCEKWAWNGTQNMGVNITHTHIASHRIKTPSISPSNYILLAQSGFTIYIFLWSRIQKVRKVLTFNRITTKKKPILSSVESFKTLSVCFFFQ